MNLKSYLYRKLRRETSTGNFIAEIDGLRFLAVMAVIVYHVQIFFVAKTPQIFSYDGFLYRLVQNGFKGVELFFVISGFILAMPFAKHFLAGGKKPSLKSYYYRRLTRLEPPYFLALILFFGLHLVKGVYPVNDLWHGLIQNLLYIQNFVPFASSQPIIGNITWTLEIEVQFYLIAPFLAGVFSLSKFKRRAILAATIMILPIINSLAVAKYVSLYNYLFYFLIGFVLADLYITEKKPLLRPTASLLLGLASLSAFMLIDIEPLANKLAFIASLAVFIYLALNDAVWRKVFSHKLLTTIGGMCYTLYLFHTVIISGFGNKTVFWKFSSSYELNILMQTLILLPPILIISGVYFVLVEKPCMDKDWPLKLRNKLITYRDRLSGKKETSDTLGEA